MYRKNVKECYEIFSFDWKKEIWKSLIYSLHLKTYGLGMLTYFVDAAMMKNKLSKLYALRKVYDTQIWPRTLKAYSQKHFFNSATLKGLKLITWYLIFSLITIPVASRWVLINCFLSSQKVYDLWLWLSKRCIY